MSFTLRTAGPPPLDLEQEYARARDRCDRTAIESKWLYQRVWAASTLTTWLTLLLAIAALALPQQTWLADLVLRWAVPLGAGVVTLATLLLLGVGLRGRWRDYRRAAEHLATECMRYRLRLPPYDKPDCDDCFRQAVREIVRRADRGTGEEHFNRWRLGYFWRLVVLPAHLARPLPHTPCEPGALPSSGGFAQREQAVVVGRLQNQQRWHLLKARRYFRIYLLFQLGIIAVNVGYALSTYFARPELWLVAGATALALFLYAWRDFLDLGALFQRYVRVAGNLDDLHHDYAAHASPFDVPDEEERLRRLGRMTEDVLSEEFLRWHASASAT